MITITVKKGREKIGVVSIPDEELPFPPNIGKSLLGKPLIAWEREAIVQTLHMTKGNRRLAADILQVGERTLYRKVNTYDNEQKIKIKPKWDENKL